MLSVVLDEGTLELRQAEEITLLGDALDGVAANETTPVHKLVVRTEDLILRAIPAFVLVLVDVTAVPDPAPQLLRRRVVALFGRSNEIVVRDVQRRQQIPELLSDAIGKVPCGHSGLLR